MHTRILGSPYPCNLSSHGCVIRPIPVHFPGAIQSPNEA